MTITIPNMKLDYGAIYVFLLFAFRLIHVFGDEIAPGTGSRQEQQLRALKMELGSCRIEGSHPTGPGCGLEHRV